MGTEPACQCRRSKDCQLDPWARKIPWRRKWQLTSASLPEKSLGQRSLVGYSPKGHRVRHNWATKFEHECVAICQKKQTTQFLKMGRRSEQTVLWRKHMKGQKVHEKILNITTYQSKVNQNYNEGRRKWQPTPVFLPGKVHGQRSLVGCSPWGYMTEHACMRVEGDGLVAINW